MSVFKITLIFDAIFDPTYLHFDTTNRSWGVLGRLGSVLGRLGSVLAASWAVLGASWAHLGASWARLGPSWWRLGRVLGRLGRVLGRKTTPNINLIRHGTGSAVSVVVSLCSVLFFSISFRFFLCLFASFPRVYAPLV